MSRTFTVNYRMRSSLLDYANSESNVKQSYFIGLVVVVQLIITSNFINNLMIHVLDGQSDTIVYITYLLTPWNQILAAWVLLLSLAFM